MQKYPINNFNTTYYCTDSIDPSDSYNGYKVKLHTTVSCDIINPRLLYDGIGKDDSQTDLNIGNITNPTSFEDENQRVATPSFSYDGSGADCN